MNNKLKVIISLLIITILTYGFAWGEMYFNSKKYYKDAMKNYNDKNYVIAIKGKKVEKDDGSGYEFKGGFQHVMDIWDSSYAIPKPKVYKESKEMINEIINKKIDIKTGTEMFNKYFKLDKTCLNAVMLRVADLYIQADDKEGAKETLKLIEEAFPNDNETQKNVKERLKKLD